MPDELTLQAVWYALDEQKTKLKGDAGWWPEGTEIAAIEAQCLNTVPCDLTRFSLYVTRQDGSGWMGHYKRSGSTWVRVHSDNLLPRWFPSFGCGLILAALVALMIIGVIYKH